MVEILLYLQIDDIAICAKVFEWKEYEILYVWNGEKKNCK